MQFYLLSIVTNLLAGVALSGDYLAERFPGLKPLLAGLGRRTHATLLPPATQRAATAWRPVVSRRRCRRAMLRRGEVDPWHIR